MSGCDNKKALSNLRNAKVCCLKNSVRYVIAEVFQLTLDDSEH
jgi:hypothetical protein